MDQFTGQHSTGTNEETKTGRKKKFENIWVLSCKCYKNAACEASSNSLLSEFTIT
jgi:hypothetical protein